MVSERSASPEPVATVINEERCEVGAWPVRPPSLRKRRPRPTTGGGLCVRGGRSSSSSSEGVGHEVRVVSFEASSLVDNFSSYKASGPPHRVLYYDGANTWVDFTGEALAALRGAFEAGLTSVELLASGGEDKSAAAVASVVDFLRMVQTDLGSGAERSVAWIDVHGRCFFPKRVVEIDVVSRLLESPPPADPPANAKAASSAGYRDEPYSSLGETSSNPTGNGDKAAIWADDSGAAAQHVDRSADYFKHVERVFLLGMRRISPDASVTAVRRCTHAGAHGGARLRAFVAQAQFTKTVRGGDANIKAAWYPAASPDEVDAIVRYGFGAPNCDKLGVQGRRYGSGVYLIPPQGMHLHPSRYFLPHPDINGERHLLLCRTVVGSMEKVELGSRQSHPSSDHFDTGADDPLNPRLHIIWTTKMNTHVIPECVVTFRCSAAVGGPQQPASPTRKPAPARRPLQCAVPLTFLRVYAEIIKFVPPSAVRTLDALLERYKARKIPKDAFIRHLRSVAGTGVLAETIRKFRQHR